MAAITRDTPHAGLLRNVGGTADGDNPTDLSDNLEDDGDRRQPDLRGTVIPVREC